MTQLDQQFIGWVVRETAYPDLSYHNFLREQSSGHDEIMEVGVQKGSSFIAMLSNRKYVMAHGIDNFQNTTLQELKDNCERFGVKDYCIQNQVDSGCLEEDLYHAVPTFVHLDADHSMEGTLCELYTCHQAPSVKTIVVHDLIDDRVHHAVDAFHKWNHKKWNMRIVGPEVVFNGCILLERKETRND